MSDIEQELEEKEVERIKISVETPQEPAPPVPETKIQPSKKKTRSPAQIAAFDKAQEKRRQNVLLKKEKLEKDKQERKQLKQEVKQKIEDEMNSTTKIREPVELTKELVEPIKPEVSYTKQKTKPSVKESNHAPIINNYYYGTTKTSTKPKRRKKKVVESSSDDSDSDYEPVKKTIKKPKSKSMPKGKPPIIDTPQDNPYQREINKLKFSYG